MISVIVLAIVFLLIAVRRIGKVNLHIWQIMLAGAILLIVLRQISPLQALYSINYDVIIYLFGMFIVGEAFAYSGYLSHISYILFNRARSTETLLLYVIFVMGGLSALVMNDTVAIVGTALVINFARTHKISSKMLLLALCFSITIGSVLSPIGNPQNLIIAFSHKMQNPFVDFGKYLFIPTVLNMLVLFIMMRVIYKEQFHKTKLVHEKDPVTDKKLFNLCRISLIIILLMIGAKILLVLYNGGEQLRLTYIALAAASPIIIFSGKRIRILRHTDWHTLVFFAAMFVVMQTVWNSGVFQHLINRLNINLLSIPLIMLLGVIVSQLVSNVPFVALYLPVIEHAGGSVVHLTALACASTIAGNLFIMGAASNIIIIHNAEKKSVRISFWEFARIGIPLTIINMLIYLVYFLILGMVF